MRGFHGSMFRSSTNIRIAGKGLARPPSRDQHRRPYPDWSRCYRSSASRHGGAENDIKFKLDAVTRPSASKERTWAAVAVGFQSPRLPRIQCRRPDPYLRGKERPSSLESRGSYSGVAAESNGQALVYKPRDAPPDAIMILAGGQTKSGGVPIWVERRLDAAIAIYHAYGAGVPMVCMGGGTPHRRPILSDTGHVLHEGASLANYLVDRGIPPSDILKEWGSYDTVANAYFALVWHALPRRWANVTVVTSEFHMPRSRLLFEWIFGLEGAALPRDMLPPGIDSEADWSLTGPEQNGFNLNFVSASDAGIDPSIIDARRAKEAKSVENVKKLMKRIRTLPDFHAWFHIEHKAYNVADQQDFGRETIKDPALSSY